jgi:hypothetical protein
LFINYKNGNFVGESLNSEIVEFSPNNFNLKTRHLDLILESKKERKVNEDVMPVFDTEAGHWKSFRWDSVKQVTLTI